MSDHTPTPWIASNQYLYAGNPERSLPIASGQHDWATDRGGASHEEAVANAAFIVKACNSHDALVKALEEIGYIDDFLDANTAKRMLGIARDALSELCKNAGK